MNKPANKLAAAAAFLAMLPYAAHAQQMDMEAMAKWGAADVVRYHIVGVHRGTSFVAGDGAGQGEFADRVVIDLTWKLSEARMVGAATLVAVMPLPVVSATATAASAPAAQSSAAARL